MERTRVVLSLTLKTSPSPRGSINPSLCTLPSESIKRKMPPNFGIRVSQSFVLISLLSLCFLSLIAMADSDPKPVVDSSASAAASAPAVHIVYTEKPEGEEPEAYHIRTLTSVLGSEDAAKEALLYSYKSAASGFSAKLTPQQVAEISKQPGVLQVVPSKTLQLHSGRQSVQ